MSSRKQDVYKYLVEHASESPSVREICAALDIKSTSTVHKTLGELEEMGLIERDAKNSRAIRLDMEYESAMVPLVGRITAGKPILAVEEIDESIDCSF